MLGCIKRFLSWCWSGSPRRAEGMIFRPDSEVRTFTLVGLPGNSVERTEEDRATLRRQLEEHISGLQRYLALPSSLRFNQDHGHERTRWAFVGEPGDEPPKLRAEHPLFHMVDSPGDLLFMEADGRTSYSDTIVERMLETQAKDTDAIRGLEERLAEQEIEFTDQLASKDRRIATLEQRLQDRSDLLAEREGFRNREKQADARVRFLSDELTKARNALRTALDIGNWPPDREGFIAAKLHCIGVSMTVAPDHKKTGEELLRLLKLDQKRIANDQARAELKRAAVYTEEIRKLIASEIRTVEKAIETLRSICPWQGESVHRVITRIKEVIQ